MISWNLLPAEIRLIILEVLLQNGCSLADYATVSREWQTIIERYNFSRIRLTPSRLAHFGSMEYNCTKCQSEDPESWGMSNADNTLITTAFQDLFLSVWEQDGDLVLDISVYSPSDSEHWFKYLTLEPDVASDVCGQHQHVEQSMLVKGSDQYHGWIAGKRDSIPNDFAIEKVFEEIMGEGPFDDEEQEGKWWQQLPLVPAVTGVLLRQQTRRRWKPAALAHMFSRLPGLQEINYEPWREWCNIQQPWTDRALQLLLESLASDRLRRVVLFENFNQTYPDSYTTIGCDAIRTPSYYVSRAVAKVSLTLQHLSASFMVDASDFFHAQKRSWEWPNLTWLALTSRLLAPKGNTSKMDDMLRSAAEAAMKMPNLRTMEIWNGEKGLAVLFRYQRAERGLPAVITWRGNVGLTLRSTVIQTWDSVALMHGCDGLLVAKDLMDAGACVKSHGDAICELKLSRPVIRPVSLRQIQMEHRIREGVQANS